MISLITPTRSAAAPVSGGRNLASLFQDMLDAWIAHHRRMADLGLGGEP